jgi:SAM-dependent methyltransferase
VLPSSLERILRRLSDDDVVLDVGGWAAPLNRADWILDLMPYETRGGLVAGGFGPGPERFDASRWVQRDICDREPWPWPDDFFDFAVCVTTLEDIRDPVGVCQELSRVAKAGYIEVPTVYAELLHWWEGPYLGHEHHRWLCEIERGELVVMHKPHSIHADRRLRVHRRWTREMDVTDHLQGLFWEGELRARERVCIGGFPTDELAAKVRERFQPSRAELASERLRERTEAARALALAGPRRAFAAVARRRG